MGKAGQLIHNTYEKALQDDLEYLRTEQQATIKA